MGSKPRVITVAAAQLGPVKSLDTPRKETLGRMIALLDEAAEAGVRLVVYPELAFTTFFPSHIIEDPDKLAGFLEPTSRAEPYAVINSPNVKPLIDRANELGVDVSFGFGERFTSEDGKVTDFNSAIYYSATQKRGIGKYRKVHLPGRFDIDTRRNFIQQLEKRYFTPGDLGFQAFRVPDLVDGALKAADAASEQDSEGKGDPIEGYNTTAYAPQYGGDEAEQEAEALFHHCLSCQSGSYTNACYSINVAKAGWEDHGKMIAGSSIIDPNGHIIAESKSYEDELVIASIDLAKCRKGKERVFAFGRHRRIEHYSLLSEQVGVKEPPLLR
ncbi:unnamed protein product [Clonostachys chloroleuca]|uniref:CN hydrolase domain-containing protein n=1 Tax=Clonostachys chloroleuca TaxID=1926264 RepID=A0AA35MCR4_9HYPO|nr:unnamed protein product [Clonostachys chloroleuca]